MASEAIKNDPVMEKKDSQCKQCLNNDKEGMSLCLKFGVKPFNYQWNYEPCPLRKINE